MKNLFTTSIRTAVLLLLAVVAYSCTTPEATTIIVTGKSEAASPPGEYAARDSTSAPAIHVLQYGEVNSILSLDPLFANNNATRRIDMLIYEGLTRYNQNGNVIPGIAKSWDVSNDSLTYTFHLNTSIYYQDKDAFSSGIGRQVSASDVKFTFDRMALDSVPPSAAKLFMDINGFDTFYKEQHQVINTTEHTINEVPGIKVPNDSTVTFQLDFKDPYFIRKLASPLAVIYPPEAVLNDNIVHNPVGTGPFQLLKEQSDTLFVLVKNPKYHLQANSLDRIEIRVYPNEQALFKGLASNEIDYIPELGPAQMNALLNTDGRLLPGYEKRFNLIDSGGAIRYALYFNTGNLYQITQSQALSILMHYPLAGYVNWVGKNNLSLSFNRLNEKSPKTGSLFTNPKSGKPVTIQYQPNEPEQNFLRSISDSLSKTYKVVLVKAPVVSRSILFYSRSLSKMYEGENEPVTDNEIFRMTLSHKGLSDKDVSGIRLNKFAWWQDLTSVSLPHTTLK